MTFGEKLRALRQSKKLTQEELAASLRITSRTLIKYEQGRCLPKQTEVQHFINEASALFAGGMLSDEDRDYVVRAINDLYWEAREARYRLPSDGTADDSDHAS